MNKKRAIEKLLLVNPRKLTESDQHFLHSIEKKVENHQQESIRKRQRKIIDLNVDALGYVAYLGDTNFPRTCESCLERGTLEDGLAMIRHSDRCQLNCRYCYYHGETRDGIYPTAKPTPYPDGMIEVDGAYYDPRDVKLLFKEHGRGKVIRWVSYEPLLVTDTMFPLMSWFNEQGFYQSLNTNGVLATKPMLKRLADAGLNDLRFNPAATLCSDLVLRNMQIAKDMCLFDEIGIESPMFHQFKEALLKNKEVIFDVVDYIAFQELQLKQQLIGKAIAYGPYYRYHMAKVSPLSSRQLVYDVIEQAADEDWHTKYEVLFHDCSNECKFSRAVARSGQFGYLNNWVSPVEFLPIDWYKWAIKTYWKTK